jgi:hypothetical protein
MLPESIETDHDLDDDNTKTSQEGIKGIDVVHHDDDDHVDKEFTFQLLEECSHGMVMEGGKIDVFGQRCTLGCSNLAQCTVQFSSNLPNIKMHLI